MKVLAFDQNTNRTGAADAMRIERLQLQREKQMRMFLAVRRWLDEKWQLHRARRVMGTADDPRLITTKYRSAAEAYRHAGE